MSALGRRSRLLHPYRNPDGSGSDSLFVQFVVEPLALLFTGLAAVAGLVAGIVSIPFWLFAGIACWLEKRSLRG